jgi:soluble lytic murein transglycosylase-like protein
MPLGVSFVILLSSLMGQSGYKYASNSHSKYAAAHEIYRAAYKNGVREEGKPSEKMLDELVVRQHRQRVEIAKVIQVSRGVENSKAKSSSIEPEQRDSVQAENSSSTENISVDSIEQIYKKLNIPRYDPYINERIEHYAKGNDIDVDLVRGMVLKESTFNPMEHTGRAWGLLQLEPPACRDMGVQYPCTDIDLNLKAGTGYFKKRLDDFKDTRIALAAYNCGPSRVEKLIRTYGNDYENIKPHLPKITREYVCKVIEYQKVFKQKR